MNGCELFSGERMLHSGMIWWMCTYVYTVCMYANLLLKGDFVLLESAAMALRVRRRVGEVEVYIVVIIYINNIRTYVWRSGNPLERIFDPAAVVDGQEKVLHPPIALVVLSGGCCCERVAIVDDQDEVFSTMLMSSLAVAGSHGRRTSTLLISRVYIAFSAGRYIHTGRAFTGHWLGNECQADRHQEALKLID